MFNRTCRSPPSNFLRAFLSGKADGDWPVERSGGGKEAFDFDDLRKKKVSKKKNGSKKKNLH